MSLIGNTVKGFGLALGYGAWGIGMFVKYLLLTLVYSIAGLIVAPMQIRSSIEECDEDWTNPCRHIAKFGIAIASLLVLGLIGAEHLLKILLAYGDNKDNGLWVLWLPLAGTNTISFCFELGRRHSLEREKQKPENQVAVTEQVAKANPPQPKQDEKSAFDVVWDKIQAVEFPTEEQAREFSNEVLKLATDGKVSGNDALRLSKVIENARENAVDHGPDPLNS